MSPIYYIYLSFTYSCYFLLHNNLFLFISPLTISMKIATHTPVPKLIYPQRSYTYH